MIQTQYTPEHYTGDGTTANLAFTWRILAKSDVVVKAKDTDGIVTTLVLDSDYTIDDSDVNTDDGGDVVLDDPSAWDGFEIFIIRNTARTQLVNIEEGARFSTALVMKQLDRDMMILQELYYRTRKSLKFADASTFVDVDVPDPEEGLFLGWLNSLLANLSIGTSRNEESVSEGAEDIDIVFDNAQANANYLIISLTANWATTLEWSGKLTTGFTVTFGTPAPAGAKLVWSILAQ